MKPVLLLLFCTFVFVLPVTNTLNAQTDTSNKIQVDTTTVANTAASAPDDEFNLFLLTFGAAFLCAIIIASFIGALGALIIIGFVFAMTSAGIVSTSFIVGFYKKSFAAGFKTLLIIAGMITGIFLGAGGLWIIVHLFKVNLSLSNTLWVGAAGGCVGGILMGLVIFKVVQLLIGYLKNKLKLSV